MNIIGYYFVFICIFLIYLLGGCISSRYGSAINNIFVHNECEIFHIPDNSICFVSSDFNNNSNWNNALYDINKVLFIEYNNIYNIYYLDLLYNTIGYRNILLPSKYDIENIFKGMVSDVKKGLLPDDYIIEDSNVDAIYPTKEGINEINARIASVIYYKNVNNYEIYAIYINLPKYMVEYAIPFGPLIKLYKNKVLINANNISIDMDYWDNTIKYITYNKTNKKRTEISYIRYTQANIYKMRGMYCEAIRAYNQAIEINQEDINAHLSKADIYVREGNYEKARQYIMKTKKEGCRYNEKKMVYVLDSLINMRNKKNEIELKLQCKKEINIKEAIAILEIYGLSGEEEKYCEVLTNILKAKYLPNEVVSIIAKNSIANKRANIFKYQTEEYLKNHVMSTNAWERLLILFREGGNTNLYYTTQMRAKAVGVDVSF